MLKMKHWQDAVNALLGVWLVLSPWVLGFSAESMAVGATFLLGLALLAAAMGAIFLPRAWEEWTEVAIGVLTLIAPWLFGIASQGARFSMVLTGIVVVALALWTLIADQDYHAFHSSSEVR